MKVGITSSLDVVSPSFQSCAKARYSDKATTSINLLRVSRIVVKRRLRVKKLTSSDLESMSASPPKADMCSPNSNVCLGPIAHLGRVPYDAAAIMQTRSGLMVAHPQKIEDEPGSGERRSSAMSGPLAKEIEVNGVRLFMSNRAPANPSSSSMEYFPIFAYGSLSERRSQSDIGSSPIPRDIMGSAHGRTMGKSTILRP